MLSVLLLSHVLRSADAAPPQPIPFVPNHGQFALGISYVARGGGSTFAISGNELLQRSAGSQTRMRLLSAAGPSAIYPAAPLPTQMHYYVGDDPSRWVTDVPTTASVVLEGAFEGVDVLVTSRDGGFAYDFLVRPGADPSVIAVSFPDAERVQTTPHGDLEVVTNGAAVRHRRPIAYQTEEGRRSAVEADFVVDGDAVRVAVGDYDRSRVLIIDPTIWVDTTFLGGSEQDGVMSVASFDDPAIAATVAVGYTESPDFTLAEGLDPAEQDVFVMMKLSNMFQPLWIAHYGGSQSDLPTDIAVRDDPEGPYIYVSGSTGSNDFAASGCTSSRAAFVFSVDPWSGSPIARQCLGATQQMEVDQARAVTVADDGTVYLVGATFSTDFPDTHGTGPFGALDAFVTSLDADLNLLESRYLGGSGHDVANDVVVHPDTGAVWVVGGTESEDYPSDLAQHMGDIDGFTTQLDPVSLEVRWSNLLGGSGRDVANGAGVENWGPGWSWNNQVHVVGTTTTDHTRPVLDEEGSGFPMQGLASHALQPIYGGGDSDGFLYSFQDWGLGVGIGILHSTYIGGSRADRAAAVTSAKGHQPWQGGAIVAGDTDSDDLPPPHPIWMESITDSWAGGYDGSKWQGLTDTFVVRVVPQWFNGTANPPSYVARWIGYIGGWRWDQMLFPLSWPFTYGFEGGGSVAAVIHDDFPAEPTECDPEDDNPCTCELEPCDYNDCWPAEDGGPWVCQNRSWHHIYLGMRTSSPNFPVSPFAVGAYYSALEDGAFVQLRENR